jgi:iron(III) transport system permease protein
MATAALGRRGSLLAGLRNWGQHLSPFNAVAGLVTIGVVLIVGYPLLAMLWGVFVVDGRPSLGAFASAWNEAGIGKVMLNTAIVVAASVTLGLLIATLFAWVMERTDARMGWASSILPLVPLMVPALAGTVGWVTLLSPRAGLINVQLRDLLATLGINLDEGPLNIFSWWGMIFLYTIFLVPFGYLVIASALRNLDPSLEEASRVNGAGVLRTFVTVTLPSIKPALAAAVTIQLIIGFAMFAVPATVGVTADIETLSVRVYRLLTFGFPPRTDIAVVLSLVMLVIVGISWWVQRRIARTKRFSTIGGRTGRSSLIALGKGRWAARSLVIFYLLATSLLPVAGVALISIQGFWSARINWGTVSLANYERVFNDSDLSASLTNSVVLGVQGGLIAMVAAVVLALYMARHRGVGARIVDNAARLPATLPHLVIAVAFVVAFAGPPFNLGGSPLILLGAYLVMYLPQAVISANSSISQIGNDMIEASLVSGAGNGRTFRSVILPLMWPGPPSSPASTPRWSGSR